MADAVMQKTLSMTPVRLALATAGAMAAAAILLLLSVSMDPGCPAGDGRTSDCTRPSAAVAQTLLFALAFVAIGITAWFAGAWLGRASGAAPQQPAAAYGWNIATLLGAAAIVTTLIFDWYTWNGSGASLAIPASFCFAALFCIARTIALRPTATHTLA